MDSLEIPIMMVACGSYHVAVLTNAGEVYTWSKDANGRLGHGDIADRKVPTLVEALRDRSGSCFTATICQHADNHSASPERGTTVTTVA